LPESVAPQVATVVRGFLARGWDIGRTGRVGRMECSPFRLLTLGT